MSAPHRRFDPNIQLLCPFNGQDEATASYDHAIRTGRHTLTANGDVKIDSAQAKFGPTSSAHDGTGDYWAVTPTTNGGPLDFDGSQAFQIDVWFYKNSASSNDTLISKGGSGSDWNLTDGRQWNLFIFGSSDDKVYFQLNNAGSALNAVTTTTVSTGAWSHVRAVYTGSNAYVWLSGGGRGSAAISSIGQPTTRDRIRIGLDSNGVNPANGWLDDLRVSVGGTYATPTSFTPPAQAWRP